MIAEAHQKVAKHAQTGVLLDTNLLVLLLVGHVDAEFISQFKRTSSYEKVDYQFLVELLRPVATWVITPHVAAETSNLGQSLPGDKRERFASYLKVFVRQSWERCFALELVVDDPAYQRFGVTDASLCKFKRRAPLVLTDDLPLYLELERRARQVIKYSHLRTELRGLTI